MAAANRKVLRAIEKLGSKVTLGDVILAIPDFQGGAADLRREILVAAEQAGAHLETQTNGEILYIFPARAWARILTRNTASATSNFLQRIATTAWRLVRVAFGLFLFGSIIIVVAAIAVIAILVLMQANGGGRGGGRGGPILPVTHHYGGGGGGGPFYHHHRSDNWLLGHLLMRDMFWLMYWNEPERRRWRQAQTAQGARYDQLRIAGKPGGGGGGGGPNDDPWSPGGGGGGGPGGDQESKDWWEELSDDEGEEDKKEGFLEAIFAFVFGRGDPNLTFDGRKWRAISCLLRANHGAVYAEQVAPFLDSCLLVPSTVASRWWLPRPLRSKAKNEDATHDASSMHEGYMLEVLTRYGGHAESSDDGRLVYVFPHMQTTVLQGDEPSSSSAAARAPTPPVVPAPVAPPIYERQWALLPGGTHQNSVILLGMWHLQLQHSPAVTMLLLTSPHMRCMPTWRLLWGCSVMVGAAFYP
ncbi:hypothetical protein CYMTET_45137 [Cymbomonas tetramitiformis]|uniref:Uncharacterized protein n=1 Tax=Cymbomonas tetramitiformis TaxID=36881 RepID=A0AAE0C0J3_9CHLO|nr:hypothetical protein CYMTET_45137 [Cymbomonas tetramitiformis]